MIRHIYSLAGMLICSLSFLSAQPVKLQPSEYALQLPEGYTTFTVDESKVMLRFSVPLSNAEMAAFFSASNLFEPFDPSWVLPFPDGLVAHFKPGGAWSYLEKLDMLKQQEQISFSAPVLVYNQSVQQAVYDLFYVRLADSWQLPLLREQARLLNFTIEKEYMDGIYFCRINKYSAGNAFEVARYLQSLKMVEFAEPDFIYWGHTSTNDSLYGYQWHLNNTGTQFSGAVAGADLDMVNAWSLSTGIPEIKVAILDCFGSLAQFAHPDFAFQLAFDATGTGFNASGFSGDAHGINCGGLIGASTNNSTGVAGIAYNARVYAIKIGSIINSSGNWNATGNSISDGITWAYQNAHIVSNSNSLGSSSSLINNAITNCVTIGRWGKGAPFFSSSGNNSSNFISYPSSNTNTIAVGASTVDDTRASFSNYGTGLDIVAPGEAVYSTDIAGSSGYAAGDYFLFSGTSAACPVAAGVMALILSVDSTLTNAQARTIIETSCEKVGGYTYNTNISGQPNGTWSTNNGYGRINAYNALQLAAPGSAPNDECTSATAVTAGSSCTPVNGNLAAATESIPPTSCSGALAASANDLWYSFVPGQPSVSVYCTGGISTDVVLGVYAGPATSPVLLSCTDVAGMNGTDVLHLQNLNTGTTYFIRVYDFNANAFSTDFTLCVQYTPAVSGNVISGTQIVCPGKTALPLTGSSPSGGAGILLDGYRTYTDFNNLSLSPGWTIPLNQDTLIKGVLSLNSFGRSSGATGVIFANNYNVSAGRRAQLETPVFSPTLETDTLRFDVAHAAYSTNVDSLIVYASNGTSYIRVAGWGSSQTVNTVTGITTANAQTSAFVPTASQWATKKLVLPEGTVQVQFEFYSDYGNRLFLDRISLDSTRSSFSYLWMSSTTSSSSGFVPATGTNTLQDYAPGLVTQTSWFRRVVNSSGRTDTSGAVMLLAAPAPKPGFTINNSEQVLTGNSFTFTDTSAGVSSRLWNFGNQTSATSSTAIKAYTSVGIYPVTLKVGNPQGCTDSVSKNIKVYPDAPNISANSFSFQSVTTTNMQVSWNNGNGQQRILLARQGSPVTSAPANGISYQANNVFGSGSELGAGTYVVYKGSGNTVLLNGLTPATSYYFTLVEFNGDTVLCSFQPAPYLTGTNATALPVTWLTFTATKQGDDVLLRWSTAAERNNSIFTLEKQHVADHKWNAVGIMKGKGNTTSISEYLFTDLDAFAASHETLLYRIKQTDLDGRSDYSVVRVVEPGNHINREPVAVCPNPNKGVFLISAGSGVIQRVTIYDGTGRPVRTYEPGQATLQVDLAGFAKGVYAAEVWIANSIYLHKILVE